MAPHLGAHLCRCTGYVKVLDAIEAVAQGTVCAPALSDRVGGGGSEVRGGAAHARRPRLRRRHPRARHAARRAPPDRSRPRRHRRDRHVGGARGAGRRGGVHRRRPAGRAARRDHLQGLAGDDPDRRPHVVRRRRARRRRGRHPRPRPGRRRAGRGRPTTSTRRTPMPVPPWPTPRPLSVWGTDSNVLSHQRVHPRRRLRRGASPPARSPCTRRSRPSASSTRSSNPSRPWRSRPATVAIGTLHVYSGGQGVWDDRNDIAAVLDVEPDAGDRRTGLERRRVRRQGGHEQPGADRARRLDARSPGEVHAVARGELPDARQASSDRARVLGRLRRRRSCSPR